MRIKKKSLKNITEVIKKKVADKLMNKKERIMTILSNLNLIIHQE